MTKIWNEAFLKKKPQSEKIVKDTSQQNGLFSHICALAPIVMLAALTVIMGLAAKPALIIIQRAADQLMNPAEYITTVLGGAP